MVLHTYYFHLPTQNDTVVIQNKELRWHSFRSISFLSIEIRVSIIPKNNLFTLLSKILSELIFCEARLTHNDFLGQFIGSSEWLTHDDS